jgi:hypothetical protein
MELGKKEAFSRTNIYHKGRGQNEEHVIKVATDIVPILTNQMSGQGQNDIILGYLRTHSVQALTQHRTLLLLAPFLEHMKSLLIGRCWGKGPSEAEGN